MTTAIETAEVGRQVILLEKLPSIGGRVAAMNQYFPKLCPPTCGIEINLRRLRVNPNVRVLTLAEVVKVSGEPGNLEVEIKNFRFREIIVKNLSRLIIREPKVRHAGYILF